MLFEPFNRFIASEIQIKSVTENWERGAALALRRLVFCQEQRLFDGDDRDTIDSQATHLVAVSQLGVAADSVIGTVRIHEESPGLWWGSRLAVAPEYRRIGVVGTELIRLAVSTARAIGCNRFLANVQSQNGPLFQRLHWRQLGELQLHGKPHVLMEADLGHYPPCHRAEIGFFARPQKLAA